MNNTPSLSSVLSAARGILFDMDGVLIDSEPVHEEAIVSLSEELGDKITDIAIINSFKGAPEKSMAARLIEMYPLQTLSAGEIILRKVEIYTGLFGSVQLVEGAKEFVMKSHAAGRKHGLTTSAARASQKLTFETFGLAPYFDVIVTGEDIVHGKPDPEPFLMTAEKLGLGPEECVVIEDSINGVRSGKAAGCKVIAITSTFPREELIAAGADFLIDSFSELA